MILAKWLRGFATIAGRTLSTMLSACGTHVRASVAVAYADARYTQTWTEYGFVVRQGLAIGALPHVVAPWNVTASLEYSVPLSGSATGILRAEDIFRSRNPGPFQDDDPAFAQLHPGQHT